VTSTVEGNFKNEIFEILRVLFTTEANLEMMRNYASVKKKETGNGKEFEVNFVMIFLGT
jgi:hypothetical protein